MNGKKITFIFAVLILVLRELKRLVIEHNQSVYEGEDLTSSGQETVKRIDETIDECVDWSTK